MRPAHCALLAFSIACARDLDVPTTAPLSVSPSFASVAPREALALKAAGGTGSYTFSFAQGGKLSGAAASVDATGLYQAGALGSAQDVIDVRDSSGARVQARIAVGPRLFLSPPAAQVAPGGHVLFNASGGKPPYLFQVENGTASMTIDAKTGLLFAGTQGSVSAKVTVADQLGDPLARDAALVTVGESLKLFAPGGDALTPYGVIDLIATGGQPPYQFALSGNSGGSVDAQTGHYQAGPSGGAGVQDVVRVTDQFAQSQSVALAPGPPLSVRISSTDLHPGDGVEVIAAGGKPPWSFAFDPRGNRSAGQIDAITGLYTPGPNFGATDVIVVRDSTPGGLASASATGTPVGPQRWTGLRAARRFTGDLNGDGRADLLSVAPVPIDPTGMLETRIVPAASAPVIAQYHYAQLLDAHAVDLNGDGHADVALLQEAGLRVVLSNPDGTLGGGAQVAARTDSAAVNGGTSLDRAVLAWGTEPANASPTKESFFFPDYSGAICATAVGIVRVDWTLGATASSAPSCALNFTFKTPPAGLLNLAAADLNLDGNLDLAWVDSSESGKLHVAYGPAFTTTASLSAGSGLVFAAVGATAEQSLMPFAHSGGSGLLGSVQSGTRRGVVAFRAANPAPTVSAFFDPTAPSGPLIWGLVSLDPAGTFLAFDRLSGAVHAFDTTLAPLASPLPSASFAVDAMAVGDVDGDHAADVLVGNTTLGLGDLVLGDGLASFGKRPRITGVPLPLGIADIDGDGATDIVTVAGGSALQVIFRAGTQFAYGPLLPVGVNGTGTLALGKFAAASAGRDVVFQQGDGSFAFATPHADGTFDAPVAMHMPGGSTAYTLYATLRAANFGDGPNADLFARVNASAGALLHDPAAPDVLTVGAQAPSRPGSCQIINADVDGNGIGDVVAGCSVAGSNGAFLQVSTSTGSKDTLAFNPWLTVYTSPDSATVERICTPSANEALIFTTREIAALTWSGGSPKVTVTPLGSWAASATVTSAICTRIDGDALPDIVLIDSANRLHIFLATAVDQFVEAAAPLVPASSVSTIPGPTGVADLLLRPVGSSTDFTVLLNDGTGAFP